MTTRYRSHQGLTACPSCKRHVVAAARPEDTHCPFCAGSGKLGQAIRGGVVAASLLALSACGPQTSAERVETADETHTVEESVPVPVYGVPVSSEPDEPEAEPSMEAAGIAPSGEPPQEEAEPEAEPEASAEFVPAPNMVPSPRYGRAPR